MQLHRPLLAATFLAAGVALAQSTGAAPSNPASPTPSTNSATESTGSTTVPPGPTGTTPGRPAGEAMTPPVSSALGTTPAPEMMLADLHLSNAAEIELGKIAEQRGQSKDVKTFAKHMVSAHTGMDRDAQTWAKQHRLTIGTPPQDPERQAKLQALEQKLQALGGAEFDRSYMQAMVDDHTSVLNKVKTFEQQATDQSLHKLLQSASKQIADHKKDAERIRQKLDSTAAR
jgi:putative membrane protein